MRLVKRLAIAAAAAAVLAGCSTGSIGMRSDIAEHPFEVGKTTRKDVVDTIGLPQRMEKDEKGNDHYFYERKAHLTGMCLGCGVVGNTTGLIPAAAVESSKSNAKKNAIEFVFSPEGTLIAGF